MAGPRVAHLHLELDLDATPIAGSVGQAGAEDRRFSGWIELTRSIEQSLEAARGDLNAEPHVEAKANS